MPNDMELQQDEMKEIIDDFLVEADELISSLDNNLVKLETTPEDLDLLNEIFRAVHTIKGTSSFLGFEQVTTLAHHMEDILNKLRKSEMKVTPEVMDILLESLDLLKELLDNVRQGNQEELDLTDILKRLSVTLEGEQDVPQESPVADNVEDTTASLVDTPEESDSLEGDNSPDKAEKETKVIAPDQTTSSERKSSDVDSAASAGLSSKSSRTHTIKKTSEQTIRVDVERLDSLLDMMGELVLGRNSLQQSLNKLNRDNEGDSEYEPVNQAATSVNFITTELQMAVMKMRMQPVDKVFKRFPRLVRDLARDSHKEIELKISGESTELDRSVIEEIGDPLVHIIRNSCDHGIETPEERTKAGKPPKGTINLDASQEGSNIIIKITDDGRGFGIEAIKAKAIERGLVTEENLERMSDREIFRFVFEAGLSTAKVVTDVSGRGVGMDVVRSNIEKLSGVIELESEAGKGSVVTIKLPLTLAIIQGLLIQCNDDVFILPLSSVSETVKTEQSDISYVNKRPVLRLRDEIIPIINLSDILSADPNGFIMTEKPYIVVVGLAEKKLGLIVDRFLGQEEVVIKSLGSYLGSTEGVAGATILGDGRIRLIVDIIGLFNVTKKIS
ncbi:MAG: chemotaxis protein CheA [candidate division Zixibacteria bacterium]|nr:chemotaxis protein CheA [candidate division Zixibacteria bacterium]